MNSAGKQKKGKKSQYNNENGNSVLNELFMLEKQYTTQKRSQGGIGIGGINDQIINNQMPSKSFELSHD